MTAKMYYEPREDSYLILKHIKEYVKGAVLDMGTGSGILAEEAAKYADEVIGADINEYAVKKAQEKYKNIKFVCSDLFSYFRKHPQKFDLIIFNPPYLPEDKDEPEDIKLMTTGGKYGYELIEKFLSQAKNYLKENGKILLLFSSLTNKNKVDEIISKNNYNCKEIDKQKLHFEELYIYLIKQNSVAN